MILSLIDSHILKTFTVFHLGGPFDLMSRRLIVASSEAIAQRIAKAITEFQVGRDDTDGQ